MVCGSGRRDLRLSGRTLKRNEAQEGVGRPHRQRCGPIPDPTTEQGLEAGAFDPPTSTDGVPATVRCERGRWSRGNGRKARAAVTRYGCRRGFLRRVRILHRGDASRHSDHPVGRPAPKRGGPQDRQRDATSPQIEKRRKPSRWCETTRAERDFGGWYLRGRSADWPSAREWTLGEHVDGGAKGALLVHVAGIADGNPGEKVSRPGRSVQLRRGVKVRRFARHGLSGSDRATGSAEHLEDQPGDGQGRGGGGEHQPAATQDRSGAPPFVAR